MYIRTNNNDYLHKGSRWMLTFGIRLDLDPKELDRIWCSFPYVGA